MSGNLKESPPRFTIDESGGVMTLNLGIDTKYPEVVFCRLSGPPHVFFTKDVSTEDPTSFKTRKPTGPEMIAFISVARLNAPNSTLTTTLEKVIQNELEIRQREHKEELSEIELALELIKSRK